MPNHTLELTSTQVLARTSALLSDHLPLTANGYVCSTDDLVQVILGVGVKQQTIESVCRNWLNAPHPETIRQHLNKQLRVEDLPDLEKCLNQALSAEVPQRVRSQAQDVAIDLHDRPYYGKQPQVAGLWVRGRARDGTTRFYRIASAYVMRSGLRVTVAVRFVLPEYSLVEVVTELLKRVRKLGLRIQCLFLDKAFAVRDVVAFLERRRQPALIACPVRGKQGGLRQLCQGRQSYCTQHTFRSAKREWTAQVALCRAFTTAKRTKRLKRRLVWQVYILVHLDWSARQARRQYRRRFGIESSYRCANQVRGWTTSPNPVWRFMLMALAFILLNVWVHLRWFYTQIPRRGRRRLAFARFRLARFAQFLRQALDEQYHLVSSLVALVRPKL